MHNLLNNCKIVRVSADGTGTASASANKLTIVDMDGYEGVMFVAQMGDVVNTAVITLRAAGATTNSSGAMTLLVGSATFTADATSADDKCVVLDVYKPPYRYIEAQLTCATANAPYDSVLAILYKAGRVPVTQGSSVVASSTLDSPTT